MLAVERGPGGQFGLVVRFHALLAVPPGAAAVEVGPDLGGADGSHAGILTHLLIMVLFARVTLL